MKPIRTIQEASAVLQRSKGRKQGLTYVGHSGDAGDLIYGLPVMRKLLPDGFGLVFTTRVATRRPWSIEWAANIATLLSLQPYIEDLVMEDGLPVRYDMDMFRPALINDHKKATFRGKNITHYHAQVFSIDSTVGNNPWLTVDHDLVVDNRPVVISKTRRYPNPLFPWLKVWSKYHHLSVFIGTPDEHRTFCSRWGKVPRCMTASALDIARLIKGAKLFIANQSLPYAIAEGIKTTRTVLECAPRLYDCVFPRENAHFGFRSEVILPDV